MEHNINNKKATIYDIAKMAGVSTATVSRVVTKSDYGVRTELRDKVLKCVRELKYTPNELGRMLKKRESHDIGVVIPTISNPYYSELILGIELEARKRGYNIVICNSFRDPETEKKYIYSLNQKQVRGIILSAIDYENEYISTISDDNHNAKELIDESENYLTTMMNNGMKFAVLDNKYEDANFLNVFFDYEKGGYIAAKYLIEMGHRQIAFITSPLTRYGRRQIFEGFKKGLNEFNIDFNDEFFICSEYEREMETGTYEFKNGKELVKQFLSIPKRPDAIFAINDITAFGVISGLLEAGVNVPNDISVMGFDNIEFSSMTNPSLTTVNQPAQEIGRKACMMLINALISNEDEKDDYTIHDPEIVVRNSVKNRN